MSKASTSTTGGGGGISQRYGILGGIVDIVVPSRLFHGGTILIENPPAGGAGTSIAGTSIAGTSIAGTGGGRGGGGDADSTACSAAPTVDTYSRTSRRILETAIDPKVINERFTPAATRTLHGPYLRQFETAFDLFLMQNPSLIPGNADTIDALRRRLLEVCEEKAMVEIELRGQLEAIEESKRAMERELTERLRVATREKAERRVELERAVERAERAASSGDASSSAASEAEKKAAARQTAPVEKSAASVNPAAAAEMRGPPNNTTRHGHAKTRTTMRINHRRPARRCPAASFLSASSYSGSSRCPSHGIDPPHRRSPDRWTPRAPPRRVLYNLAEHAEEYSCCPDDEEKQQEEMDGIGAVFRDLNLKGGMGGGLSVRFRCGDSSSGGSGSSKTNPASLRPPSLAQTVLTARQQL